MSLKSAVLATPVVGEAARGAKRLVAKHRFPGSETYWQLRYQDGGTSGAGSYGRLAKFKAEVLNKFVVEHRIESVLELGCGDGAQLALADYPRYTGVDVAEGCVEQCRARVAGDATKTIDGVDALAAMDPHDLTLSLDVIYHLVEDDVFEQHMTDLFRLATRYVLIYSSNASKRTDPHVRHRKFTQWVEANAPQWHLVEKIPNRYPTRIDTPTDDTSFADFYVFARS